MTPAVHIESKTRSSARRKQRIVEQVARGAWGVQRLLPVEYLGRIIAWVGWNSSDHCVYAIEHKPWMQTWIDRHGFLLGFPTVDSIIKAATVNGKLKQTWWHKWSYTSSPQTLGWTHWYGVEGHPSAGSWSGTAYTARQHTDAEAGAINHGGNVSTDTKHIISGFTTVDATSAENTIWCLYDMVISYDQCALSASLTNFTNTLTAQRYNGTGLPGMSIMGCENTVTTGTLGFTSITYTDQDGNTGITVPNPTVLVQVNQSAAPGPGHPAITCFGVTNSNIRGILTAPLAPGDSGARLIESVQMTGTATDQNNYILGFLLAWVVVPHGTGTAAFDFVKQSPSLPRVYDGACLSLATLNSGTTSDFYGGFNFAWGT